MEGAATQSREEQEEGQRGRNKKPPVLRTADGDWLSHPVGLHFQAPQYFMGIYSSLFQPVCIQFPILADREDG